jgi:hypothetical protein
MMRSIPSRLPERPVDRAGRVHDADGAAHDRHRHAHGGEVVATAIAQHRATVERVAVGEDLDLRTTRGDALIRRPDRTAARCAATSLLWVDGDHAIEVCVAVVGEQQLHRGVGNGELQTAADGVEGRVLVVGHLERASEHGLELTAVGVGLHEPLLHGRLERDPDATPLGDDVEHTEQRSAHRDGRQAHGDRHLDDADAAE